MSDLMKGKRGLIMGVANDHSIAWVLPRRSPIMVPNLPSPIRERLSAAVPSRWRIPSVPRSLCRATWKTLHRSTACSTR